MLFDSENEKWLSNPQNMIIQYFQLIFFLFPFHQAGTSSSSPLSHIARSRWRTASCWRRASTSTEAARTAQEWDPSLIGWWPDSSRLFYFFFFITLLKCLYFNRSPLGKSGTEFILVQNNTNLLQLCFCIYSKAPSISTPDHLGVTFKKKKKKKCHKGDVIVNCDTMI